MNESLIQAALRAHRELIRVYRHPERAPAWLWVKADLIDAETWLESLDHLTADQALLLSKVHAALKRNY